MKNYILHEVEISADTNQNELFRLLLFCTRFTGHHNHGTVNTSL